jgi:hypothetical protein
MYRVSEGVHFRNVNEVVIILDLRNDRYLQLLPKQSQWMRQIISSCHEPCELAPDTKKFADRLIKLAVLSTSTKAPEFSELEYVPARTDLSSLQTKARKAFPAIETIVLLRALLACRYLENKKSLAEAVKTARSWKRKAARHASLPAESVISLVQSFHSVTPLFLSTHLNCRFRSLLLLRYLSAFGVAPDWIFGVQVSPFSAHCWLEWDGVVLNDFVDNTLAYEAIMKV